MVIEGNVLQFHPVEAGVRQCAHVSAFLFEIHTAGLPKWPAERVQVKGLSIVDDLGWVATGKHGNQVVDQLEACAAESIDLASS